MAGRCLLWARLMKKMLIADYLADNLVNRVFDTPQFYSGLETLVAVYGFAIQLYYDFSGYTDIALGSALLLGLKLPRTSNNPTSREHRRLLAEMAHFALQLAAGLSLLFAARPSVEMEGFHLPESRDHHVSRRAVARPERQLRDLGTAAWRRTRPATGMAGSAR